MSKLSASEKKGLLVLSGILLVAFIVQSLRPYYIVEGLYDYSVQDSIFKAVRKDSTQFLIEEKSLSKKVEKKKKVINEKSIPPDILNINTATLVELEKLPRIGPATAKNIVEYRKENGSFKTKDELSKVKRIGPKTLELIKPFIRVD